MGAGVGVAVGPNLYSYQASVPGLGSKWGSGEGQPQVLVAEGLFELSGLEIDLAGTYEGLAGALDM